LFSIQRDVPCVMPFEFRFAFQSINWLAFSASARNSGKSPSRLLAVWLGH
jgi:hypothetical protein